MCRRTMKYMDERIAPMRKFFKIFSRMLLAAALPLAFASCMGIDASAKIDTKGSGVISLEYQISKEFVQLGTLESTPALPLPLSREDIEKSLTGMQGIALKSYAKSEKGDNIIISFSLSFDSPSNLAVYLDPRGKLVQYTQGNGTSHFTILFGNEIPPLDPQMKASLTEELAPYRFRFSLECPNVAPHISVTNGDFLKVTSSGKKSSVESSMSDLITATLPPQIDISWD